MATAEEAVIIVYLLSVFTHPRLDHGCTPECLLCFARLPGGRACVPCHPSGPAVNCLLGTDAQTPLDSLPRPPGLRF